MSTVLAYMSGPFFLGFALESFGMGIVLILSINYFMTLASQPKSPHESSRKLGVSLVGISLVLNLAQTMVDLYRGWDMFANNFTNISGFLTSTPSFFISPFLGLIQSTLTQLFLLRRITLFISSLDLLWPKLAHPLVKYFFAFSIGAAILASFVSGTISSVLVWKIGSLISLGLPGNTSFARAEQLWLAISTAVDMTLSAVLSVELWWARQKLGMQGGVMREIVTRLILVTCHGGIAVSALQLSSILLYHYWRYNAFCYLPILFLPKVYNITLVLSLSVPHSTEIAPDPSHMFSLPTILDTQAPSTEHIRRVASPLTIDNPHSNPRNLHPQDVEKQSEMVERPRSDKRQWISWSVGAIPSSSSQIRNRQSQSRRSTTHQRYSYHEDHDRDRDRCPSDPNSICPLLAQSPQDRSSFISTHPLPDHTILPSPPPSSVTVQRNSSILTPTSSQPLRASFGVTDKYTLRPSTPTSTLDPFGTSYSQNRPMSQSRDTKNAGRDGGTSSGAEGAEGMSFMDMLDTAPNPSKKRRRFSKDV
ncbi:hypothetical protein I302_103438 [Kwoniella bestiolae CBS 10118]|uniref:Uncharacterized protein n=1 Tax=Kwoniella bestiolae CBS 10118 TaxID=1296100 RepID=A0A1B9G8E3_9TREE|nr:hypothetical protein I302_02138 [Kwoniella bestiolae CBS 10118]OCF27297.1 hypothetical protein I302_02138 [Kwoniella bestiolae CBS 10118]